MHPELPEKPIGEHIAEVIKSGKAKMRPRWYFRLRNMLAILALVIILLAAVFFLSFIIFILRGSGTWFVPVFGLAGWYSLFLGLPWVLLALSTIFIVALAILAKRYPLGYQWPLVYSLLAIFFLIVSISFLFIRTSFYHGFFDSSAPRQMPLLDDYYPGVGIFTPSDIHRGNIEQIQSGGFVMGDMAEHTWEIIVVSSTELPTGYGFQAGDVVVVFGNTLGSGTIQAVGVEDLTR